ncbi:solute carrier family 22 member 6-B-like [Argopecten irradians]|uniref:solute carrier family 22 member 6-B-like n=1 Tax=Argopecten irradians TaxID=31199 RepID=UPI003719EC0E
MDGPLDVDQIWKSLGTWGRYQRGQMFLCLIAVVPVAFHLLCIVFIAYRPPHQCKEATIKDIFPHQDDYENSTYRFVFNKCSIDVYSNETDSNSTLITSTDCVSGYKYDVHRDASIVTEWDLFCEGGEVAELAQTMVILGQGIGAVLFSALADRYGRKPVHVFCHISMFAVTLGTAWSSNPAVFIALRCIMGALQSGTGLTVAVAALESLPVNSRYLWEIADIVCWTTGCILVVPVAYIFRDMSWRAMQIAFAVGSAYSLLEYWFLEESLRWLLANGKKKRAERIIRMAAKMNGKDYESVIKAASAKAREMETFLKSNDNGTVDSSTSKEESMVDGYKEGKDVLGKTKPEKYNTLTIFRHKRILLNSLIIWYTWTTNSLVYYALYLGSTSLSGNRYLNYFLMALVEYPAALSQWYSIKRYGRRKSCLIFHSIAGISLAVSTVCLIYTEDVTALGTVSLVFNLLGKYAITASFSTIFLYTPELYPTNLRSAGLGLASTCSRMGGMLAPFATSVASVVVWLPGAVFSVMCFLTVYLTSFLPETSGHELPTTISELKLWYKANTGGRKKSTKTADS